MKMLLVMVSLLISTGGLFAQYNDTLYYKSGMVKAVTVRQHDEKFLVYEYRRKKGKLVENRIPLDTLDKFVIYNEYGELVIDSSKPKKKEE